MTLVYIIWEENTWRCKWTEAFRQLQEKNFQKILFRAWTSCWKWIYTGTTNQRQLKWFLQENGRNSKMNFLLALQILGNCWLMKTIYVKYQLGFHFLQLLRIWEIIAHFPSATFLSALAQWQNYLKEYQLYNNPWTKGTKNLNVSQNKPNPLKSLPLSHGALFLPHLTTTGPATPGQCRVWCGGRGEGAAAQTLPFACWYPGHSQHESLPPSTPPSWLYV